MGYSSIDRALIEQGICFTCRVTPARPNRRRCTYCAAEVENRARQLRAIKDKARLRVKARLARRTMSYHCGAQKLAELSELVT